MKSLILALITLSGMAASAAGVPAYYCVSTSPYAAIIPNEPVHQRKGNSPSKREVT